MLILEYGSIRFITPDVAIMDGASTIQGGDLARSVPLLFVMKKEGAEWLPSAVRDCTPTQVGTIDVRCGRINHGSDARLARLGSASVPFLVYARQKLTVDRLGVEIPASYARSIRVQTRPEIS